MHTFPDKMSGLLNVLKFSSSYLLFHTQKEETVYQKVSDVFSPHKFDVIEDEHSLNAIFYHANLGGCSVNYMYYGKEVIVYAAELPDYYVVMPISGVVQIRSNKQTYQIKSGSGFILNAQQSLHKIISPNCLLSVIKIDRSALESHVKDLLGETPMRPIVFDPMLQLNNEPKNAWWRAEKYVRNEILATGNNEMDWLKQYQLNRLLMTVLLQVQPHNYVSELNKKLPSIKPRHIKHIEEYIEGHYADPLTLEHLASVSGVSVRTLQLNFLKYLQITPMKYLKTYRLEMARQMLQLPDDSDSVTRIAMNCGFRQLGKFSSDYRKRYGELPSVTLRR